MAQFFRFPYIAGTRYEPGNQPNNPGEPGSGGMMENAAVRPIGWPGFVPGLLMLNGNPGVPRLRAPLPVVNQFSTLPNRYLFLGGIVKKSQG